MPSLQGRPELLNWKSWNFLPGVAFVLYLVTAWEMSLAQCLVCGASHLTAMSPSDAVTPVLTQDPVLALVVAL